LWQKEHIIVLGMSLFGIILAAGGDINVQRVEALAAATGYSQPAGSAWLVAAVARWHSFPISG
jgi:hypothetical protein